MGIPSSVNPLLIGAAGSAEEGGYLIEKKKDKIPMRLPTIDVIKEFLSYDVETGEFYRAKTTSFNAQKGMKAGYPDARGYVRICIKNKKYLAHRLAWVYMTGEDPGNLEVDHINRNKSDNRFENLRLVSDCANSINCGMRNNNTSGFRGVYWDKQMKKWASQIRHKGRKISLGYHKNIEDARDAYDKAALEIHGEYAITNAMLQEVV
jgi:hypothetical protein